MSNNSNSSTKKPKGDDPVEQINKIVVDRHSQLRLFLSLIRSWEWVVAVPDEEQDGDVVGMIVGLPHWVRVSAEIIAAETGEEFTLQQDNTSHDPTKAH